MPAALQHLGAHIEQAAPLYYRQAIPSAGLDICPLCLGLLHASWYAAQLYPNVALHIIIMYCLLPSELLATPRAAGIYKSNMLTSRD